MVELIDLVNCYNFSISKNLTQIVNLSTWIPDCESHSPALLDLLFSSDASICSTIPFRPSENSDHRVVSVSIDALFLRVAYDYYVLIRMVLVIIW